MVVTKIFATTYKQHFSRILALTRDPSSPPAKHLATLEGVEVVKASFVDPSGSDSLVKVLKGVDIVINVLGAGAKNDEKDMVATAAVEINARAYFPSEFGV